MSVTKECEAVQYSLIGNNGPSIVVVSVARVPMPATDSVDAYYVGSAPMPPAAIQRVSRLFISQPRVSSLHRTVQRLGPAVFLVTKTCR